MNNRLAAIAEEMGVVLGQTGYSPNIKERRDFSCALFDGRGEMVAQAAHLPVHLGSTPLSVPAAPPPVCVCRRPRPSRGYRRDGARLDGPFQRDLSGGLPPSAGQADGRRK